MSERRDEHGAPPLQGHEERDVHYGNVMTMAVVVIGLLFFGLLLSWGMYALATRHTAQPGTTPVTTIVPESFPPAPRVQTDPHADLLRLRAAEDSVLQSYGWVNRDSGQVRVPIRRAMDLILKKGLPVREGAAAAAMNIRPLTKEHE